MNGLSNADLVYNLRVNLPPYHQNQSLLGKEEKEEMELKQNIIKIKDLSQEKTIERYSNIGRQIKTGICEACGCSIKSKILSCSICQVSKCKICVEKESNEKSNQKKGVKKYFYICKVCLDRKMRKHDMIINYEKELNEFLHRKHKNSNETKPFVNDDSDDDSFENESSTAKKRKSSIVTNKKIKRKILPEKIYHLIEKKAKNYFGDDNNKEEMCFECNDKCSINNKAKPFSSIEQLLYYLQYYFDYAQNNSRRIDYNLNISNAIAKEKCQDSFIAECHFFLCQHCLDSLGRKYDSLEFSSSLSQLIQKIRLLNQKQALEDNIFSAPGIYSKLSIIITQFLVVQGFSFYQSQFIQCLFDKIKALNEKIAQNEYSNSSVLNSMLCSYSVPNHHLQSFKDNHLKSKESIRELEELFSKFKDSSKEIFTSFSLENNDLDQIMKMLNNCFSILGHSTNAISPQDTNNLNLSKKFIESLITKFKNIVANDFGNSESREQEGSVTPVDSDNKSIERKDKENNSAQESWPFSTKINELFPLMFNAAQQPAMQNNTLELRPYQMNYNSEMNINNNHSNFIDLSKGAINEYNIINNETRKIGNANVLFNNVPNFTLSLNNFNETNNFNQTLPQLNPNINSQNQLYQSQPFNHQHPLQQQLQFQQQLNQMSNLNHYHQFHPINPYQINQL